MPVLTLPEQTYQRLVERAAFHHVSVEEYVSFSIAGVPRSETLAAETPTPEERLAAFERWTTQIESRADRYPAGHVLDDSRESIYAERENAEL